MTHRNTPRRTATCAAALALSLVAVAAHGETAYVTDNLRLGIHQAADTSDRAFDSLESGQELEIISRDRNYANVRLPNGREGYVKAAYLVFDKPAKLIVAQTLSENESLQAELDELRAAFAEPSARISALEAELASSMASSGENESTIAALTAEVEDYRGRQSLYKYSVPLPWMGGALLVCLLAGFLFGLWWVDQRSRRRHGGIRIY